MSTTRLTTTVTLGVSTLALGVSMLIGAVPAQAAGPARPYDFDGNGYPDLVVGAPGLTVRSAPGAGGVFVLPASAGGLSTHRQVVTQSTDGVPGASEDGDAFGQAVVSADFNRDGYADLAVGQPYEDLSGGTGQGAVTVLYGSAHGLTGKHAVQLPEPSGAHRYAGFGQALAAGDLDGDGYADLAVGAPGDLGAGGSEEAPSGTVTVLRGGKSGISTKSAVRLRGLHGSTGYDHEFGSSLAVADVDADGRPDLVVVSAGHIGGEETGQAGSVSYCAGRAGGPDACHRLAHGRDLFNIESLAVGNVSGSSRPEIVIGLQVALDFDPGHLEVLSLTGSGAATTAQARPFDELDAGTAGASPDDDTEFGTALAAGDLNGDGYADLVVGAPMSQVGPHIGAGRVVVVHGGAAGLQRSGNVVLDQDTAGIPGGAEYLDGFGQAVTLLDHDRDGHLDLTVGAPGENSESGAVTTLRGSSTGPTTAGAKTFGLSTLGYHDRRGALFGYALGG